MIVHEDNCDPKVSIYISLCNVREHTEDLLYHFQQTVFYSQVEKWKKKKKKKRKEERRGKKKKRRKKCREEEMMERNITLREYQKVWNIDARFLSFHSFREWKFQLEKREGKEREKGKERGREKEKRKREKRWRWKSEVILFEKFVERNKHQIMNDFCSLIQYLLI